MKIKDIVAELEKFAPLSLQEDYDNCGLLTGQADWETDAVLVTLDCTEEVVDEAIEKKCGLIVAHHPLIFSGIKKLSDGSYITRTLVKAIKADIAIYACHTNIDNVRLGVNDKIAEKLGLKNRRILNPKNGLLRKLVTFVPSTHHQALIQALFDAGCGHIGNYDSCSFSLEGTGTFRGLEGSRPFIGNTGERSSEPEIRVETVFPAYRQSAVIRALLDAHPYEEVAYDIYQISNAHPQAGSGLMGEFESPMDEKRVLSLLKETFRTGVIRHTRLLGRKISRVAVCGGSGRFLLGSAIAAGAELFVTADFKYHEFFDADGRILLADIGHYESEQFTPELFSDIIRKKFSTFAVHLSETLTNPVNYF